jgi:hypothetical protein
MAGVRWLRRLVRRIAEPYSARPQPHTYTPGLVGIRSMRVHPGPPGGDPEVVRLVVKLEPNPPRDEHWWWRRRLGGVGGVLRDDLFEVQLDVRRSELEDSVRRFRSELVAANDDYPRRYSLDAEAEARCHDEDRTARERQLRQDQSVVDGVIREDRRRNLP